MEARGISPWAGRYAALTAGATLVLICFGGLVTSHGVGMAVPDWPNTYGYNMFFFPVSQWVGGIFYEHTHRLVASAVGLMTLLLAIGLAGRPARRWLKVAGVILSLGSLALFFGAPGRLQDGVVLGLTGVAALVLAGFWPSAEPAPKHLRQLGWLALATVVLQGVLGGLRVVLLRDEIGILHALLAQSFLLLLGVLALVSHPRWSAWKIAVADAARAQATRRLFLVASCLTVMQLLLGATMRHQHAGLAVPDFPLAYGRLWPALDARAVAGYNLQRTESQGENPITAAGVVLHMTHRAVGATVLVLILGCAWAARRFAAPAVRQAAALWAGLAVLQLLLGAATVWTGKSADVATVHVAVGSLLMLTGGLLTVALYRMGSSITRPSEGALRRVVRGRTHPVLQS